MSVGAQMVVVLKAFVERCVSLVLGHPFEFSWLDVSQTDVFHCSSPHGGSQQHSLARWIVRPIVVAYRKNRQQKRTIFGKAGDSPDGHQSHSFEKLGNVPSVPSLVPVLSSNIMV